MIGDIVLQLFWPLGNIISASYDAMNLLVSDPSGRNDRKKEDIGRSLCEVVGKNGKHKDKVWWSYHLNLFTMV